MFLRRYHSATHHIDGSRAPVPVQRVKNGDRSLRETSNFLTAESSVPPPPISAYPLRQLRSFLVILRSQPLPSLVALRITVRTM